MKKSHRSHKKSKRSPFLLLFTMIAIVLVGYATVKFTKKPATTQKEQTNASQSAESINFSPPTESEKLQAEQDKINKNNTPTSTPQPTQDASTTVDIVDIKRDGSNIILTTKLKGANPQSCSLKASKGDKEITKKADVLYQNNYSICMGFTLNRSEFASGGEWQFSLGVTYSDGKTLYTAKPFDIGN